MLLHFGREIHPFYRLTDHTWSIEELVAVLDKSIPEQAFFC